jgi:hypothetical protein
MSTEYPNLVKVLDDLSIWAREEYKQKLKELRTHQNGKKYDSYATGNLYNSVNCKVVENDDGYQVWFDALDYWINVENGRGKGKKAPPTKVLEPWIIARNLPNTKGLSYIISRSISMNGIKPQPMLREVKEEVEDKWYSKIVEAFKKDVNENFILDIPEFNKIKITI